MSRRLLFLPLLVLALTLPSAALAEDSGGEPGNFELVGHSPLFARGMNSAAANFGRYLYVGNRSDGTPGRPHPGVLVLDIGRPAQPTVVGEIGAPEAANVGESSRELRVWRSEKLLIVLNVGCGKVLHDCNPTGPVKASFKFFDLSGKHARQPKLIATYTPAYGPHEFSLWLDPKRPGRAVLYYSVADPSVDPSAANIVAVDISRAREESFRQLATWNGNAAWTPADRAARDIFVHTMDVPGNGKRAYVAHWGGGLVVLDTSDVAADLPNPELRMLTPPSNAPIWPNVSAHAVDKVLRRPFALVGDEVYGTYSQGVKPFFDKQRQGCPWGWMRMAAVADPTRPVITGEYKIDQNTEEFCRTAESQDPRSSFSAHNFTALTDVAIATWYSGGVRAISLDDPSNLKTTGSFVPEPLASVATEDPATSAGIHKVVMWSFPIIRNGLIYVIDVRNGLYVLRYTGPYARQVQTTRFLEANSNQGAARWDP